MSKLLYPLFLLCFCLSTGYAQTPIGGVINDYAAVVSLADADCFNGIEVDDASIFTKGDRALLIQMNGATIQQTNDRSFGNITDLNAAGLFEIVEIDSIASNIVYFPDSLINDYDAAAVQQLVRIPQYTDARVNAQLTAPAWDGRTGGIVILEASGSLFVQSNINVSGLGFRGAEGTVSGGGPCSFEYALPFNSTVGARKGEGVAILDPSQQGARGKAANGGGGGNMHNGGGAGGGGYGDGGKGGNACIQCCGAATNDRGGIGGLGLRNQNNRLFMGGGGGQGHVNDNSNLKAGNGGGIIILRANEIVMQGGRVMATGLDGESSGANDFPTDGHPGGGGGGAVLLDAATVSGLPVFEAWGGAGGDNNTIGSEGPGGGGGGGVVIDRQNSLPGLSAVIVVGGNAGTSNGGIGRTHGAVDGRAGGRLRNFTIPESTTPFIQLEDLKLVVDNARPCNGDTIRFNATAFPVHPNLQFSWIGPGLSGVNQEDLDINDVSDLQSGIYTLAATLGCKTIRQSITINVLPEYDILIDTFICEGEQFALGNAFYISTGFYRVDLLSRDGCDSLVQLDLEVIPPFYDTSYIQLCSGEIYDGDSYFNDTLLLASLSTSLGCDSFDYTAIQVFPTYNRTNAIERCAGDQFLGITLNQDTTIIDNNQTAFGCDSITTFDITVHPVYDVVLNEEICAGDDYRGVTYIADAILVDQLLTSAGCDSVITTNLTVHPEYDETNVLDLCAGETFLGTVYTTSTIVVNDYFTDQGCDSTVTTDITVYPVYDEVVNLELCAGETFNGLPYFRDTILIDNNQTSFGCDSITTFNLTVHPVYDYDLAAEICQGDAYRGAVYLNDTILVENLQTLLGCDSIVTTNLTVQTRFDISENVDLCAGDIYRNTPYFTSTVLTDDYLTASGCDSTVTTTINVFPVYDDILFPEICAGERFNGISYLRDTVLIDNNQTVQGCDSITTFNLRVYPVYDYTLLRGICQGNTYRGQTYSRDTILIENLQTLSGCDSTVTTILTVHPQYNLSESVTLCEGESYQGVVYNRSTVVTNNYLTQAGCDSTVTTTIAVFPTYDETTSVEICAGESFNGQALYQDTTLVAVYRTIAGCDSILRTEVTAHPLPQPEILGGVNGFCQTDTIILSLNESMPNVLWSTGDTTPQIDISSGGTYGVVVTNSFGCTAIASVDIPDFVTISADFLYEDPECFGESTGSILVDNPQGGIAPYIYSLNGSPFGQTGIWTGLDAGPYEVIIQDAYGCEYSEVFLLTTPPPVTISLSNQSNFEISLGDSLTLEAQVNQPLAQIQWSPSESISCDSCLAVRFSPLQTTDYELLVTTANGCTDAISIRITVDERPGIFAPNVFSPNGDGVNDGFTIFGGKALTNIERLIIMDRWGSVIFERENIPPNDETLGWNGVHNGDRMNPGVFVFYAELLLLDGRKTNVSGSVTLVR